MCAAEMLQAGIAQARRGLLEELRFQQNAEAPYGDGRARKAHRVFGDGVAQRLCTDVGRLRQDMEDAAIEACPDETNRLAGERGIAGTPAFVIDATLVPGVVGVARLKRRIADVRALSGSHAQLGGDLVRFSRACRLACVRYRRRR